jgi:PAS domain S-box-containing protein
MGKTDLPAWIGWLLAPPTLDDHEETHTAGLVNGILLVILGAAIAFPILAALAGITESKTIVYAAAPTVIAVVLGLKLLLHSGHVRLVGVMLACTIWVSSVIPMYAFDGIRDTSLTGHFLVIVIVSLTLGWRPLLVFSTLSSLALLGAFLAEQSGLLVTSLGIRSHPVDLVTLLIVLISTTLLAGLSVRRITSAYEAVQRSSQELWETNRELEAARDDLLSANQALQAQVTERKEVERQLRRRAADLESLVQVSARLRSAQTVREMLPIILEQATRAIGAASGCLFLVELESGNLVSELSYPPGLYPLGLRHPLGEGITGHVAATGEMYTTEDLAADPRIQILPEEADYVNSAGSQISLQLATQESIVGVIHLARGERRPFSAQGVRLAQAIADIAANAVHRAMVVQELEGEVAVRTAAIWSEKEKSEAILRSVGDGIMVVDREYRVRYVNPAYTSLTGYTDADLIGEPAEDIGFIPREQDRHALQATLSKGLSWQGEGTVRCKDGRTYDAAVIIAPVHNAQGKLTAYVSSHRDISKQKQLEQARSRFIANVSHELRTPLSSLKLYAWLLREKRRPERVEEFTQAILEQANRLTNLVEDFLEMASLDSGGAVTQRQSVPLGPLIHDAMERFRDSASKAGLELYAETIPDSLPNVTGDRIRLSQALGEILENAIAFTPAGGEVTIKMGSTIADGVPWVTIAVRDTGPGIMPEERQRIFDRLFRGHLAESGHIPGTGLGLSIAQEILRAHGGRITVDSQLDEGSTFTLWLRGAPAS